jgi:eukaryotic-like serine/threonine-protein kinase
VNKRNRRLFVASAAAIFIIVIAAGWYFWPHRSPIPTDKDTIVLADFTNSAGDPVFDGTLRQGLSVQLEQSPFLSLVSEERIRQTLRLMDKPPDAALTPEIMCDFCQRVGSKSYIRGSVDKLGNAYVIGLDAINCATGDSLAEEQVQASGKEKVLDALGHAATDLRRKLGESLTTVEKYDTPLEQATTQSLEALKAYSLGRKAKDSGDPMAAVPLLQQAILLDPKFAMAYAALGTSYNNYGENSEAAENAKKAYGLRESVSVREKFYIESRYCQFVTGDLEKARQVYELWAQAYPRDDLPMTDLGVVDDSPGQYDGGLAVSFQALRLNPASGNNRANLVSSYLCLNRLKEARAAAEEAQAKKIDSPSLRYYLAGVDFLQNDAAALARDLA